MTKVNFVGVGLAMILAAGGIKLAMVHEPILAFIQLSAAALTLYMSFRHFPPNDPRLQEA